MAEFGGVLEARVGEEPRDLLALSLSCRLPTAFVIAEFALEILGYLDCRFCRFADRRGAVAASRFDPGRQQRVFWQLRGLQVGELLGDLDRLRRPSEQLCEAVIGLLQRLRFAGQVARARLDDLAELLSQIVELLLCFAEDDQIAIELIEFRAISRAFASDLAIFASASWYCLDLRLRTNSSSASARLGSSGQLALSEDPHGDAPAGIILTFVPSR